MNDDDRSPTLSAEMVFGMERLKLEVSMFRMIRSRRHFTESQLSDNIEVRGPGSNYPLL